MEALANRDFAEFIYCYALKQFPAITKCLLGSRACGHGLPLTTPLPNPGECSTRLSGSRAPPPTPTPALPRVAAAYSAVEKARVRLCRRCEGSRAA